MSDKADDSSSRTKFENRVFTSPEGEATAPNPKSRNEYEHDGATERDGATEHRSCSCSCFRGVGVAHYRDRGVR